jgi:hypothetical protein
MYPTPKKQEILFLIDLEVTQICFGPHDIQLHFFNNISKTYDVNLSIDRPEAIIIDGKNISGIQGYGILCKFISMKIVDVEITEDNLSLIFENGDLRIKLENNGYEILTISHGNDLFII